MNIKAIDFHEIICYATSNLVDINMSLLSTGAFESITISANDVENEIKLLLRMIQGNAFRDNYKLIIVKGATPAVNYLVDTSELIDDAMLSNNTIVCKDHRDYYYERGLNLPLSSGLSLLYHKMFDTDDYSNILWADFSIDFSSTYFALREECITPLSILELSTLFSNEYHRDMLIAPHKFYYNKYEKHITAITTLRNYGVAKTKAKLFMSLVY